MFNETLDHVGPEGQLALAAPVVVPPNGGPEQEEEKHEGAHPNIFCDACNTCIRGLRYKCTICADYDLCRACYSDLNSGRGDGSSNMPVHSRFHPFRSFEPPNTSMNGVEIRAMDENEIATFSGTTRLPVTAPTGAATMTPTREAAVHDARCDNCDQRIVGTRHKCSMCADYDMCDVCYAHCRNVHHLEHAFRHYPTSPANDKPRKTSFGYGPSDPPTDFQGLLWGQSESVLNGPNGPRRRQSAKDTAENTKTPFSSPFRSPAKNVVIPRQSETPPTNVRGGVWGQSEYVLNGPNGPRRNQPVKDSTSAPAGGARMPSSSPWGVKTPRNTRPAKAKFTHPAGGVLGQATYITGPPEE